MFNRIFMIKRTTHLDTSNAFVKGKQLLTCNASTSCRTKEQTFIMIKPDGVKRHLIAKVIEKFEQRGYKLIAMKFIRPSRQLLNEHYKSIMGKPFYRGIIQNMESGPVVPMVWQGLDVVNQGRLMIGDTNPLTAARGTIRGDYTIDLNRNAVHGSDSVENASNEIALWFDENELMDDWNDPIEKVAYIQGGT